MKNNAIIGIIGGTGILGTIFKKFFEEQGYEVLISGRSTELTSEEMTKKSDVIIFCVPIDATIEVIKSIVPQVREDQLIMDFTSIKSFPIEEMLKSKASVIGLHPMFGKVESVKGKTIVVVPARPGDWQEWVVDLFKKGQMNVKIATADKHDKIMSVLQGLVHFNYISLSHTLKEESEKLGLDINELLDYGGVIYKLRLGTMARILQQDPELYADISMYNKETKKRIEENVKQAEKLKEIINSDNKEEFVKYFNEGADFYKDFGEEALNDSVFLIEQLSKLKLEDKE